MLSLDSEEETEVAVFAMEASEGYCTFMKMASPEGMDLNISPPTCLTPVTKDMSPFSLKDRSSPADGFYGGCCFTKTL